MGETIFLTRRLTDYLHRETLIDLAVLNLESRSLPPELGPILAADDILRPLRAIEMELGQWRGVQCVLNSQLKFLLYFHIPKLC